VTLSDRSQSFAYLKTNAGSTRKTDTYPKTAGEPSGMSVPRSTPRPTLPCDNRPFAAKLMKVMTRSTD